MYWYVYELCRNRKERKLFVIEKSVQYLKNPPKKNHFNLQFDCICLMTNGNHLINLCIGGMTGS